MGGLEWMAGTCISAETSLHASLYHRRVTDSQSGSYPLGLLHELATRAKNTQLTCGKTSSNPDQDGIYRVLLENTFAKTCRWEQMSIWGSYSSNIHSRERLIFDLGQGLALQPTEVVVMLRASPAEGTQSAENISLSVHLAGFSEFEAATQTLVMAPVPVSMRDGRLAICEEQLLRISIP